MVRHIEQLHRPPHPHPLPNLHHPAHPNIHIDSIRQPQRVPTNRRQIHRSPSPVDALMSSTQPAAPKNVIAIRPPTPLSVKIGANIHLLPTRRNHRRSVRNHRLPNRTRHKPMRIIQSRKPLVIPNIERIELRIRPRNRPAALPVINRLRPVIQFARNSSDLPPRRRPSSTSA